MAVTTQEIARLIGLSQPTVSQILNNKGQLYRPETRQRVLDAAEKLGYRPHFAARSLSRQSTHTLGIYVMPRPWAGLHTPYAIFLLRGLESACREQDYDLMLINLTKDQPFETCRNALTEHRVDGLMLLYAQDGLPYLEQLCHITTNLVAMDACGPLEHLDTVSCDTQQAVSLAIEHLQEMGHRRIGFLGSCIEDPLVSAVVRQRAFVDEIARRGLPADPAWVHHRANCRVAIRSNQSYCQLEGYWGVRHLMALPGPDRPTALVIPTNTTALGAYWAMAELGLAIPQDLALISLGDSERCTAMIPMLSNVDTQLETIGRLSAERLIQRVRFQREHPGRPLPVSHQCVSPQLHVRGSTDPAFRGGLAALEM